MSRKANPKLVGAFVLGALALVVAGVLVFGSSRFFRKLTTHVLYFEGSVKGLNVGAPVLLRGVKIGSVASINVLLDAETLTFLTPVVIKTDPNIISLVGKEKLMGQLLEEPEGPEIMEALVERGLRAKLEMKSLVTGQVLVEFDFHPGTPVHLVRTDDEHPELPTIPSDIRTLTRQIRQLRIEELVANARKAMQGIQRLVNSPDLEQIFGSLNQTLKDLGKLARNVDSKLEPVTSGMEETLKDTRKLVQSLEAQVVPLASGLEQSAAAAQAALTQAKEAFAKMEGITSEDSALVYQLTEALDEFSAAARSIRVMASYLERHPEALLRGKAGTGGK